MVDNLHTIWRTITIGVVAAVVFAILTAASPLLLIIRDWVAQQLQ